MHEQSDAQLLRDYAESGNEAAFRELVQRHTDFIYSAALRQVESSDLACDIAQGVFTDLARKAKLLSEKFAANNSLAGWLHRGARYAALNHLRDSRRRLANERQAMEQLLTDSESSADWEQIRPALDEALDSLADEDREALLLRYFKNQDFRAVGHALGVSDDAAQKRVSRAMERLREFFSKRGVTVGAGGLAVLLSANAVHSAPVALVAQIVSGALATSTLAPAAGAATKTIAMTALQKCLIVAVIAVSVSTPFVLHQRSAGRQRAASEALEKQNVQLAQQQAENERLSLLASQAVESRNQSNELLRLRAKAAALQGMTNALPRLRAENRRLQAAADLPDVEPSESEKQEVEAKMADNKNWLMASYMYSRKNKGQFPPSLSVLASGQAAKASDSSADQFEIVYQGSFSALAAPQNVIVLKQKSPVRYGNRWAKVYGYGDGHVEMHVQAGNDFTDWENEHIAKVTAHTQ